MSLISPRTLARIQLLDESAMPSTCTIYSAPVMGALNSGNADGSIPDGVGGWTHVDSICRVVPATREPVEGPIALMPENVEEFYVSVPVGTVVKTDDRIQVFGTMLEVTAVGDLNSFATSIRVNAKRMGDVA